MKKKIAVLGASGSIGRNTIDVIRANRDYFDIALLSSHSKPRCLLELKEEFPGALLVLSGAEGDNGKEMYSGKAGLLEAIRICGADIAVNGIAGAAGLESSLAALECGIDLALANKETIVMAAPLVFNTAEKNHARIIPVDSEHSAVFTLIEAHGKDSIDEILLTASGGPFRSLEKGEMAQIRPEDALAHPTWHMGPKITIDSSTLANKGLEVIEAVRLFNTPAAKVKVAIHPQSIVHSMVRLRDGAVYAQMSNPDMRLPIHTALFWPQCRPCGFASISFDNLQLSFEKPDTDRFPMLALAYEAAGKGGLYPAVYNAANEVAVAAFLERSIRFTEIPSVTENVLQNDWPGAGDSLPSILEADEKARISAKSFIKEGLFKTSVLKEHV